MNNPNLVLSTPIHSNILHYQLRQEETNRRSSVILSVSFLVILSVSLLVILSEAKDLTRWAPRSFAALRMTSQTLG